MSKINTTTKNKTKKLPCELHWSEIHDLKAIAERNSNIFNNLTEKIDHITIKINEIFNIKVNGTVGLENALKQLYLVTADLRNKKTLYLALEQWIKNRLIFKVLKIKLIKNIITILLIYIIFLLSKAHQFPTDLLKFLNF